VWSETVLDSFNPAKELGFDFLKVDYKYERTFEEVLGGGNSRENLEPPWQNHESPQRFWTRYLDGPEQLWEVSGREAYRALVPFRGAVPAKLTLPLPDDLQRKMRLTLEAFYYPHGLALVITVSCRDTDLTLTQIANFARWLQSTRQIRFRWRREERRAVPLDEVARTCLTKLRGEAFSPELTPDARSADPFTVFTVVKGSWAIRSAPKADQIYGDLLSAITGRHITGNSNAERQSRLTTQGPTPEGNTLYGIKRGRAVWFPDLFTHEGETIHSLSCYHKNLVFASLQVESLGSLVSETAQKRQDGRDFYSSDHRECVRQAAVILGRLYEGSYSTYRSWSTRAQIEHNGLRGDIDRVRAFFDMSPLPSASSPGSAATPLSRNSA
jgi:hypothetical protein